jgi:hypothetical protein
MEGSEVARLLETALERARGEYDEYADNWKLLDSKAQALAAVAGVFLAAVLAFFSGSDQPVLSGSGDHVLASLIVALLVASILFAMWSQRLIDVGMPTSGRNAYIEVRDAIEAAGNGNSLNLAYRRLLERFLVDWIKANDALDKKCADKAKPLRRAQWCLVLGATLSAVLALIKIWT